MQTLWQDLRYGLRMTGKNPALTMMVTLTLALGIGVNTALFTMFHLFDRPLPLKKPGSIVMIEYHEKDDASHFRVSFPEYLHLRNHTTALSDLAAGQSQLVTLAGQGDADGPLQVPVEFVSDTFFSVFETNFALGRGFTPEETRVPFKDPVVVLSYGLWQRRFGGDPHVVGKPVPINGLPFTVIGVTARDFVRYGSDWQSNHPWP